jgi:hypothetical protein
MMWGKIMSTTISGSTYIPNTYSNALSGGKSSSQTSTPSGGSTGSNAVQQFLNYQKMTPEEKIRAAILQKLGLTEDDLAGLSSADRKNAENEIKTEMEKMVKNNMAQKGILLDITV